MNIRFFLNNLFLYVFMCFCASGSLAFAQVNPDSETPASDVFIYKKPTLENLSQLYWALSLLDIEDDNYIDNFLRINECDIYNDYIHHEFEWQEVRAAAREKIKLNKKSFPLRFELVQEIKLGEYDLKKERFEVLDEYKIERVRRFNIPALDANAEICGDDKDIYGYPKAFILELSRPFMLKEVSATPEKANRYISKNVEYVRTLREAHTQFEAQTQVYNNRKAYVVMQVKMFAYNGNEWVSRFGVMPKIMGVLEGIQIYADDERKEMFYSKSYRKRRSKSLENQDAQSSDPLEDSESVPLSQPLSIEDEP